MNEILAVEGDNIVALATRGKAFELKNDMFMAVKDYRKIYE